MVSNLRIPAKLKIPTDIRFSCISLVSLFAAKFDKLRENISRIYAESPKECLLSKPLCRGDSKINSKSILFCDRLLKKVVTADTEETSTMRNFLTYEMLIFI